MKNTNIKKISGLMLCLIIMLQSLSFTYAAVSPAVSSYELLASNGSKISLIQAGEKADLEITIKDSGITT
ncbi:MAG: hypothetical protein IJR45_08540, partial [Firmicutes bacterium]|nr:hypothetical protein [Bacillota bacterium]